MFKKTFIAILLLSSMACVYTSNIDAVEELMENAGNPDHIDYKAGVTDQDIMNSHMDEQDEYGLSDIHQELKELKQRIKQFTQNPEDLDEDEKQHLINRAKILEELRDTNDNLHEEINEIMEGLANLKADKTYEDGEEADL